MFDAQSEMVDGEQEVPEKAMQKIEKLEDSVVRLNLDVKEKNEKIIELLGELEEIKIQVFARDKSIELQQKQIEDLLEELKESKGLENDLKIIIQKKRALQDENERLREELTSKFLDEQQAEQDDGQQDLILINNGLNAELKKL